MNPIGQFGVEHENPHASSRIVFTHTFNRSLNTNRPVTLEKPADSANPHSALMFRRWTCKRRVVLGIKTCFAVWHVFCLRGTLKIAILCHRAAYRKERWTWPDDFVFGRSKHVMWDVCMSATEATALENTRGLAGLCDRDSLQYPSAQRIFWGVNLPWARSGHSGLLNCGKTLIKPDCRWAKLPAMRWKGFGWV